MFFHIKTFVKYKVSAEKPNKNQIDEKAPYMLLDVFNITKKWTGSC